MARENNNFMLESNKSLVKDKKETNQFCLPICEQYSHLIPPETFGFLMFSGGIKWEH